MFPAVTLCRSCLPSFPGPHTRPLLPANPCLPLPCPVQLTALGFWETFDFESLVSSIPTDVPGHPFPLLALVWMLDHLLSLECEFFQGINLLRIYWILTMQPEGIAYSFFVCESYPSLAGLHSEGVEWSPRLWDAYMLVWLLALAQALLQFKEWLSLTPLGLP